jgi:ubiquinone/menaquinone biosynthesis C-methylase UbiE
MIKKLISKPLRRIGIRLSQIQLNDIHLYHELYDKSDIEQKRFYNVGAGLFSHPVWTNVDYFSEWYKNNQIHINYDLFECKPLPISENTANVVYSSHTVEHITNDAAQNLFNESYRILKSGGYIRITTPNIDLYHKALINNDSNFYEFEIQPYSIKKNMDRVGICQPMNKVSLKQIFIYEFASQLSTLYNNNNKVTDEEFDELYSAYDFEEVLDILLSKCEIDIQKQNVGNHINWWNQNKLFRMLIQAGFSDIYLSGFGQSLCPVLRDTTYFDTTHPQISIYVEARK